MSVGVAAPLDPLQSPDLVGRLAAYSAATHAPMSYPTGFGQAPASGQWSYSNPLYLPSAPTRSSNSPDKTWQSQAQAGPSKYTDPWCATTSSINLTTGNRFSQLLEEKLGMEKQRNPDFAQDHFYPMNWQPATQYSNQLLAVETALHDLSQVVIPPDLVAPLPDFFPQDSFYLPPQSTQAPAPPVPSGPFTWTMSAKAYEDSLPPLLKIRVHSNDATVPPPVRPAPNGPGTWAVNLISDPSAAWGQSPVSSSTHIPTPPPDRKRRRTASDSSKLHDRSVSTGSARDSARSSSPQTREDDGEDKKVIIACYNCRAKKLRCDGDKPKCHHCKRRGEDKCEYDTKLRRRGPGKKNKLKKREPGFPAALEPMYGWQGGYFQGT